MNQESEKNNEKDKYPKKTFEGARDLYKFILINVQFIMPIEVLSATYTKVIKVIQYCEKQ